MKTYWLGIICAAGLMAAWTDTKADDRTWGDGTLPEALAVYDVDGDGVLSVEEIQAMKDARRERRQDWLEQWDLNGDGVIDASERAAAREALRDRIEERRSERFEEADSDGDGCLTFEEFSAIPAVMELAERNPDAPARIYDRLDADDDGCVTREEFMVHLRHHRVTWRTREVYLFADRNRDGCLSYEEFSKIPAIQKLSERDPDAPGRIFNELDTDGDGCLTLEEFMGRPPPQI